MENNLVSIITPMYNSEKYIQQCIESVINQTYKNIEMIIIDDGSTDKSRKIVLEYANKYDSIKYIKQERNMGIAEARNKGIRNSKGRFIAFLDSDDLYKKDKIEKQINFMIQNNYAFTYTSYDLIDENSLSLNKVVKAKDNYDYETLLKGNNIGCLTVILDKEKINCEIEFSKNHHEDYILWLKLLKNNVKAYGMDETLSSYRKTNSSISHNKFKAASWTWYIYRKIEKLTFFKSVNCFIKYTSNGLKKS